ncbi:MAG TPA: DinB family protein [Flavitalea sp.]|nr:DinB family protein [Flavitalea sp.]
MEQQEVFVQMALKAWNTQVNQANKFFDALPDDSVLREVAPGKNRVIYLLGHLIAVNDTMISLFGLGERLYAHLDEAFVKNPDRSGLEIPEISTLKADWKRSNEMLVDYFNRIPAADWFKKHTAMTDEDLVREPTRNKLSVLINRTNHLSYHLGQLLLVKDN